MMMQKFTAMATAFAFAAVSLAPAAAEARERRSDHYRDGYYNDRHHGDYYDHRRHRRDRDDDDDAIAAGVIGLVLGLALAAAASQPREPQARCGGDYRYCEPPQAAKDNYYGQPGDDQSAYERDYGFAPAQQCTRRERQWDRYANRYLVVDVPC